MPILCKLFGHKWEGCVCRRCEAARHTWSVDGVCTECETKCQHDWLRCKCEICGAIQPVSDPAHAWNDGVCEECGTKCQHDWLTCKCEICDTIKPLHDPAHAWDDGVCQECGMECQHSWEAGGKCEICGSREAWHDRRDESSVVSSAREKGDAEDVTLTNSEHGQAQPRTEHFATSAAVQGIGKREASTKLGLHQTEEEKTATKSRKRRRKKAK